MRTHASMFRAALVLATCTTGEGARVGGEGEALCAAVRQKPTTGFISNQRSAYSDGLHNENTELSWYNGRLLLAFRGGGSGQTGTPDAHINIFSSNNAGDTFHPIATISMPDRDIRDPKLVAFDDKLVLYAISRVPGFQFRDFGGEAWTVRSESTDGRVWTAPARI